MDAGALVIVVPTVRTLQEAIEARDWTFFPPLGKRSLGGGTGFDPRMWGEVPGGYRATANDNIVLILMIDGAVVVALFPLRARTPEAPFRVPLFPTLPALFLLIYATLLVGSVVAQPGLVAIAFGVLVAAYGLSWVATRPPLS